MTTPSTPKVNKSIKITADLNNRLNALCEHLGVNPNAYLLNEVGKAISRDEVAFMATKAAAESQAKQAAFFDMIAASQEIEQD